MFYETLESRQLLSTVVAATVATLEQPYQEAVFVNNYDDNGVDEPGPNAGMAASQQGSYTNPGGNSGWIEMIDGIVGIHGNTSADTATVYYYNHLTGQISLSPQSKIRVTLSNSHGLQTKYYWASAIDKIEFYGNAGNDGLYNFTNKPSMAEGGTGNDYLLGGGGNDNLRGREGNDTVLGGNGNDSLYGGDNADSMRGGAGKDMLGGNDGNDSVWGEDGNDTVSGGIDHDNLNGGDGNDLVSGDNGHDSATGADDADSVHGGHGNDSLNGGSGNDLVDDQLFGIESGDDSVNGEGGHDIVRGRSDEDSVYGSSGNDSLYGDQDVDYVHGGSGIDYSVFGEAGEIYEFVELRDGQLALVDFDMEDGILFIDGDETDDYILINDLTGELRVQINGDTVYRADPAIINGLDIDGLGGHDEIATNAAAPATIRGGTGDDTIRGGQSDDDIFGNGGDDQLFGRDGNDLLDGGSDNDGLYGGSGFNILTGGTGMDRFLTFSLDNLTDFGGSDARVFFENGDTEWSDNEIEVVDTGLADLVDLVDDTWLLRTHTGHDMTFVREIDHPKFAAQNTGASDEKRILFFDAAFDTDPWTRTCVYHELAHNWDQQEENSVINDFRDAGGWYFLSGDDDWQGWMDNNPFDLDAPWWVPVGDGWWRDFHAEPPARAYGGTNPLDDFACVFEALMADFLGESYEGQDADDVLATMPQKVALMNEWLNSH